VGENGGAEKGPGLEGISKSFALDVGIIHLLGFLVVTRNLSQYGVSPVSILKLQYLIAGIWLLTPLVWFCLLVGAIFVMASIGSKGKWSSNYFRRLLEMFTWRRLGAMALAYLPNVIMLVVSARFGFSSVREASAFYSKMFGDWNFFLWIGFLAGIVGPAILAWHLEAWQRTELRTFDLQSWEPRSLELSRVETGARFLPPGN